MVSQLTIDIKNGVYNKPIQQQIVRSSIRRDSRFRRDAIAWIRYWSGFDWWLADTRSFWENCLLGLYNVWISKRENQWIASFNEYENELLFIPWSCRRSPYYKKMLHRELKPLFGKSKRLCIHLTLTTDPHKFRNIEQAMGGLKKSWRKLHDYLVKKHGNFKYLATVEISPDNHLPHLHVLIFDIFWLDGVRKISKMWEKYGQGRIVHVRKMEYNRGLKEVLKYIYKQQSDDLLGAVLWATRTRSFMCSHGLLHRTVSLHDPASWVPAGYTYLGLIDRFYLECLLRHEDLDPGPFLVGDGGFRIKPPPEDWRSLLDLL